MVNIQLLSDAIIALEMVTKGLAPDSLHALAGGFGLDKLSDEEELGDVLTRDLANAAQGLYLIARGDIWRLKRSDCDRLLDLVATVRELIELETGKREVLH